MKKNGIEITFESKRPTPVQGMMDVSYEEFIALRRDSRLIIGKQYKITDYHTFYQENEVPQMCEVYNHLQVIVTALTDNKILKEAQAIDDEGNKYDIHIEIYEELKNRCMGVITWMRDSNGNEAPWDFASARWCFPSSIIEAANNVNGYTSKYFKGDVEYPTFTDCRNCKITGYSKGAVVFQFSYNNVVFLEGSPTSNCGILIRYCNLCDVHNTSNSPVSIFESLKGKYLTNIYLDSHIPGFKILDKSIELADTLEIDSETSAKRAVSQYAVAEALTALPIMLPFGGAVNNVDVNRNDILDEVTGIKLNVTATGCVFVARASDGTYYSRWNASNGYKGWREYCSGIFFDESECNNLHMAIYDSHQGDLIVRRLEDTAVRKLTLANGRRISIIPRLVSVIDNPKYISGQITHFNQTTLANSGITSFLLLKTYDIEQLYDISILVSTAKNNKVYWENDYPIVIEKGKIYIIEFKDVLDLETSNRMTFISYKSYSHTDPLPTT